MIMGIAPIIAPTLGNTALKFLSWEGLFETMAILGGLLFILTLFLLPETNKKAIKSDNSVLRNYLDILKNRKFLVYSLIAGIANGALMIYASSGPFLIMEKGGFSGDMFSLIFAINAIGLMIGSSITSFLQKYIATKKLIKYTLFFMTLVSVVMLIIMSIGISISIILFVLFFYLFAIGILFPTTTDLAITPFSGNNSGTASSLFGTIQVATAFICTLISGLMMDGTIITVGIAFFLCCMVGFIAVFAKIKD
jgi:DHA1 family bicyclomycin/chloramphenicol resistance-like MFS transporter